MSCLEHLVENGISLLEKPGMRYEEWHERMKNDVNWKGVERINIDDLWEICQYVVCTAIPCSRFDWEKEMGYYE